MSRHGDICWAAGLFEGEGSISVQREGRKVWLQLGTRDKDVLERFHRIVGLGAIRFEPRRKPHYSDMWRWDCAGWVKVTKVAKMLLPHLGERRTARITEVLAMKPADWAPRGKYPRSLEARAKQSSIAASAKRGERGHRFAA